jgi:PAS domain S-box-containing protein
MQLDRGLCVVASVRDVTDRVAADAHTRSLLEMLDAISDGVFIFDAESLRFTHVNQGAVDQVLYSRDELLGMNMLHIAPEFDEARLRALLEPLRTGEVSSTTFTTTHRRRDGVDLAVEITMEPQRDEAGMVHSYTKVVRDITERLRIEANLRQVDQELRVVEDRERIARDLHDQTIQRLFSAGLNLQAALTRCQQEDVAARVAAVVDDVDDTIRELRSVIFGLHRQERDLGLRTEILKILSDASASLGFEPHLELDGPIDGIPGPVAEAFLATLRELLSNAVRHAHPDAVQVSVRVDPDLHLRVVDDGAGFSETAIRGNGTRNLAARAAELGGEFSIAAAPGGGTVAEWSVPVRSG